jgi:uncharacterized protein YdeI (YjbR/CyaY-like superfamily)
MNPKTDFYFQKSEKWQAELMQLRKIVLDCGLTEELKWGCPCYAFEQKNVVLIHEFKDYCALLFMNGALLSDTDKILVQQTENVQATRQIRFTNLQEIIAQEATLKTYIFEAIEVERSGLKVELKKTAEFAMPEELQRKLADNQAFKIAFEALSPGRQRGYLLYFSQAKQAKTREARIEKCMPLIFSGKGWNEI